MRNRKHFTRPALTTGIAILALSLAAVAFAAGTERPYGGSCSAVVTPLTDPGVFPQELRIDYDCTLTHLGRSTAVAMQVVTPIGQSGAIVSTIIEAATIYKAANGDMLNVLLEGTALIDVQTGDVTFIAKETFDGGSGRFADATGSSVLQGTASIFTNLGSFTTRGRLAY
jgi:hypothetical protein